MPEWDWGHASGQQTPAAVAAKLNDPQAFAALRERIMTKAVLIAQRHAMQRTPVRTGTLRRSETTRVEAGGLRGFVGTNVKYAPFVHEGTRHMPARPFFTQGLADSMAEIRALLDAAGDDWAEGVAKG